MKKSFWAVVASLALFAACSDDSSPTNTDPLAEGEEVASSESSQEAAGNSSAAEIGKSAGVESSSSQNAAQSSADVGTSSAEESSSSASIESSNSLDSLGEMVKDVSRDYRSGPAVAPRVVRVTNSNHTVTIQDEGAFLRESEIISVYAKLSNDTLIATIVYEDSTSLTKSSSMKVLTFTADEKFAAAKYLKIKTYKGLDGDNAKPIYDVTAEEFNKEPEQDDDILKPIKTENGYKMGACRETVDGKEKTDVFMKKSNYAYLIQSAGNAYQIRIENVEDYCDLKAEIEQTRDGKTLYIKYGKITAAAKCICNYEYIVFDIAAEDADVTFVAFKDVEYQVLHPSEKPIVDGVVE